MNANPGKNLRRIREQLQLKYRDVEEASQIIATRHNNAEFIIGLSRLADIENKGTVPSVYRMYSLAAIYGLDYSDLLKSYGVFLSKMPEDFIGLPNQVTRTVRVYASESSDMELPQNISGVDLRKTGFLSRLIRSWGLVPLHFLNSLSFRNYRYALVGTDDWSMYPLIPPGSFIQIDESKRRIVNNGWNNEFARPIYFLELREGYRLGWCTERAGTLIVQPHSSGPIPAEVFKFPGEVEVLGQIVGVAMRMDRAMAPRRRSS